ncbi:hypothetical protein HRG_009704 [Hirsutella rhossiliensis]|uniref:Uncharacterized protein n=1 Tax=Hirsutella rhossiliensis TaxID=111463 RepID=A0A9P8MPC7_9HYPO|nr:uncharacterized protein HRG_09704 [Hirsutella rhossiliensis]KAH0959243.1 hypothetical protein HRG_09704 [Hirsutella rhossiliensis]
MSVQRKDAFTKATVLDGCLSRWRENFRKIRPPQDSYQERVNFAEHRLQSLWRDIPSHPSPDQLCSIRETTLAIGGELKELELNREAFIELEKVAHDEKMQALLQSLCDDVVRTLGPTVVHRSLQEHDLDEAIPLQPPSPVQNAFLEEDAADGPGLEISRKRNHDTPAAGEIRKRARTEIQPSAMDEGSAAFRDVFPKDKVSPGKPTIVEYPPISGKWFILQCGEHGIAFKTITGAAKHNSTILRARMHRMMNTDIPEAVLAEQQPKKKAILRPPPPVTDQKLKRAAVLCDQNMVSLIQFPESPVAWVAAEYLDKFDPHGSKSKLFRMSNMYGTFFKNVPSRNQRELQPSVQTNAKVRVLKSMKDTTMGNMLTKRLKDAIITTLFPY